MPYAVTRKNTVSALLEYKNGVTLFAELHRTLSYQTLPKTMSFLFVMVISAEEGTRIRRQSEKLNSQGNRVKYSRYGGLQRLPLFRRGKSNVIYFPQKNNGDLF